MLLCRACSFPAERPIVFRERASKSYRVSAYFLSKLVAEQPLRILSTLVRRAHATEAFHHRLSFVVDFSHLTCPA